MPGTVGHFWRLIDAAGVHANENSAKLDEIVSASAPPEIVIAATLVSIEAQLGYANTIAAARFFLDHTKEAE
jgi:hypothetical protein